MKEERSGVLRRERSRIDGRNSPSRSSCIIDGRTRGWRRVVPFLCLQIAKLRPVLRSIVGSVAMNETGAPRISNDFGPGRSTTGSRAWQTIRGSICSRTCLQATRRRPARYGTDLVKNFLRIPPRETLCPSLVPYFLLFLLRAFPFCRSPPPSLKFIPDYL